MMRRLTGSLLLVLSLAVPAAGQQAGAATQLSDADKIYGLSLLWQEVNYNFAFFDQVPELDWDGVYKAYIPRVLATGSTYEYYRELQRMIALLHDGHTGVWLPPALQDEAQRRDTYPWVVTQEAAGRLVVRAVGRSLAERIPPFSEIVEIDGRPAVAVALERRLPTISQSTEHYRRYVALWEALNGPSHEPVQIRYVTPAGEMREATLARDRRTRPDEWVPDVNAPRPPFEFRWLENEVAYVALNTMGDTMTARGFEDSLPALRRARGLVIDVRQNGGGNSSVGYRVAKWLTDDTLETSRWRTREHRAAPKAWGRAGVERWAEYGAMDAWFDGGTHGRIAPAEGPRIIVPTVILQDYPTFSAAEDFLVAMDAVPHVTMVGRPSGGSTGQPLVIELPGGGGARIVTKRDTYPDGRDFVGVGAQPDVVVERTVEDLQRGRDSQLEHALELIRQQLR